MDAEHVRLLADSAARTFERDHFKAKAEYLGQQLREWEWLVYVELNGPVLACGICCNNKHDGHTEDCEWPAILSRINT